MYGRIGQAIRLQPERNPKPIRWAGATDHPRLLEDPARGRNSIASRNYIAYTP